VFLRDGVCLFEDTLKRELRVGLDGVDVFVTNRVVSTSQQRKGRGGRQLPGKISPWWLLLVTAVLMPLMFPPFYCWFVGGVALVPFCWCVLHRPMWPRYLWMYYGLGVAFFLPNLFWLGPVTIGGLIALALYLAIYFPLFAWGLHRLTVQFRMPATIAVPLMWTAVEYFRATFVQGGFPWFMLGNSLAPVPLLLQTADLFGVWGLTFGIAMVNGFIIDLLRLPSRRRGDMNPAIGGMFALCLGMVAFAVAYGVFRLNQNTITAGPRVAVIQENIPQSIKDDPSKEEENFQRYFRLAQQAASATPHPDLIVWPETMVPAAINREILELDENRLTEEGRELVRTAKRYDGLLRELATSSQASMLVGVPGYVPSDSGAGGKRQNLTMLYVPGLGQSATTYAKVHLVPFGEYIPFRTLPLLGPFTRYLIPIDFDYSLAAGTAWTQFRLTLAEIPPTQAKTYTFATPICFEDTMPGPARMMTAAPPFSGGQSFNAKTDFLVNVSNDGWFQYVELDQHLQADQLRAVENRVPIARSVNTGDSGFVDSNGRVMQLVVNPATGSSIGAVGTLAMVMPLDSRVSLFSRIGDLLPIACGVVGTLVVGWTYVRPRRRKRR
jgi:apolipoprotein N-acyltransferase